MTQQIPFRTLYNFQTEDAKGRTSAMVYTVLEGLVTQLSAGIFYTGFLLAYGISLVNIGIITFIPFFCSMLAIFAPVLFSRVKHQKRMILFLRALYFFLNIVVITVLPEFVKDEGLRTVLIVAVLLVANLANAFPASAIASWHISFIPDEYRARHFTLQGLLTNMLAFSVPALLSVLVDSIPEENQLSVLIGIRYGAYAISVLGIFILALAREVKQTSLQIGIRQMFTLPLKHRPLVLTAAYILLCSMATQLYGGASFNTFLLEGLHAPYLYTNIINATYFVFFLLFGTFWQKLVHRHNWFKTHRIIEVFCGISYTLFFFVTPGNFLWFLTLLRLTQHILGVGSVIVTGNLPYIHAPYENRMVYVSFYLFASNAGSMLGSLLYTLYMEVFQDLEFTLLGHTYTALHVIFPLGGGIAIFAAWFSHKYRKELDPKHSI